MAEDKRQVALNEAQHWAKEAGATIQQQGKTYAIVRSGKVLHQTRNPWDLRDVAYALAPYNGGGDGELPEHTLPNYDKTEVIEFLQIAIKELEPASEYEFLVAITDHPLSDWAIARHVYRQYEESQNE